MLDTIMTVLLTVTVLRDVHAMHDDAVSGGFPACCYTVFLVRPVPLVGDDGQAMSGPALQSTVVLGPRAEPGMRHLIVAHRLLGTTSTFDAILLSALQLA